MYIRRAFHPLYTVRPPHPAIILAQSSRDNPLLLLMLLHLQVWTIHPTREFRVNLHYVCVGAFIYTFGRDGFVLKRQIERPPPPPPHATPSRCSRSPSGRPVVHITCRLLSLPPPLGARTSVPSRPEPTTAALLYNNFYNNIILHFTPI